MPDSITCPACHVQQPADKLACDCGQSLTAPASAEPANTRQPIRIDRPFDVGKPLGTPHPVSLVCPKCGANDYKAVRPSAMVAFTDDRVCNACSTRYTPPTPFWARLIFGAFGLAATGVGGVIV